MTRQRGGTTSRPDEHADGTGSGVREIGRQLNEARVERGLDLLAVHDRLSRPITLLEALEAGDLSRLPDQALALSTLRRYATFLGLDGDALALTMIDAWSEASTATGEPRAVGDRAAATSVVAAVTTGPDHLRAFTQTGEVPRVGGRPMSATATGVNGMSTGPPTGTFPVVPHHQIRQSKRAVSKARRRLRAPTWLKVVTWVLGVLVLLVFVGFGIRQWRSQWLVSAHVIRIVQPGTTSSNGTSSSGHQHSSPSLVVATETGTQSATYAISASQYVLDIATTGPCWVQVLSSTTSVPLVSGVQQADKHLSFPGKGTMTVEVGSSAVVVAVTVDGKTAFYNAPHVTPFTYTFEPASGSSSPS